MGANDRQVGGDHYRGDGSRAYQHWDLMAELGIPYFPAVITKYTERYKLKKGREDLEKALHYAEKNLEGAFRFAPKLTSEQNDKVLSYCQSAGLDVHQTLVFMAALLFADRPELLVLFCRGHLSSAYPVNAAPDVRTIFASDITTRPMSELMAEMKDPAEVMKQDFASARKGGEDIDELKKLRRIEDEQVRNEKKMALAMAAEQPDPMVPIELGGLYGVHGYDGVFRLLGVTESPASKDDIPSTLYLFDREVDPGMGHAVKASICYRIPEAKESHKTGLEQYREKMSGLDR